MNKRRLYKARPAAREAGALLQRAGRFIVLADITDDKGESSLHLYTSGYSAEALVAGDLMKVAVGIMKKYRDGTEAAMAAAKANVESDIRVEERLIPPSTELILPLAETVPPAFGAPSDPAAS